jgi:hypothetical protein
MVIQINEYGPKNSSTFVPFLWFEKEYTEETKIYEIEVEIDDASKKGETTEGLIQKRQQIIHSWIKRIENDLTKGYSNDRKKDLEEELNRARQYKNEIIARD